MYITDSQDIKNNNDITLEKRTFFDWFKPNNNNNFPSFDFSKYNPFSSNKSNSSDKSNSSNNSNKSNTNNNSNTKTTNNNSNTKTNTPSKTNNTSNNKTNNTNTNKTNNTNNNKTSNTNNNKTSTTNNNKTSTTNNNKTSTTNNNKTSTTNNNKTNTKQSNNESINNNQQTQVNNKKSVTTSNNQNSSKTSVQKTNKDSSSPAAGVTVIAAEDYVPDNDDLPEIIAEDYVPDNDDLPEIIAEDYVPEVDNYNVNDGVNQIEGSNNLSIKSTENGSSSSWMATGGIIISVFALVVFGTIFLIKKRASSKRDYAILEKGFSSNDEIEITNLPNDIIQPPPAAELTQENPDKSYCETIRTEQSAISKSSSKESHEVINAFHDIIFSMSNDLDRNNTVISSISGIDRNYTVTSSIYGIDRNYTVTSSISGINRLNTVRSAATYDYQNPSETSIDYSMPHNKSF